MTAHRAPRAPLPAAAPTGVVRRPLGPLERWYWIADQISPLNVTARARVTGRAPEGTWRRALDALQARHPLLRVAITCDEDGRDPAFVPVEGRPVPLRRVPDAGSDPAAGTRWEHELNDRELVESVDWRTGPLARAVVVSGGDGHGPDGAWHDLVLTLPHCVADGTTVLSLIREWIELAAGTGPATEGTRPVLPPVDALLPPRHRGAAGEPLMREQEAADQALMSRLRPGRVEPTEFVPFGKRRTRLVHRSLDPGQLDALVRACRREDTTVHGALAAALVAAVARDAATEGPRPFAIGSPVDFRAGLRPPLSPRDIGSYVATVPTVVEHRPGEGLWPMARAVIADLTRRRGREEHFRAVNLFGRYCPANVAESAAMLRFMDEEGPINLCLSNVGRTGFPDAVGPWRVSDAQFVAGLSVSAQLVATVNTNHGRLFWNFTHVEDALPRERADRLVDDCVSTLLAAVRPAAPRTL
ncbi:phthiocerol/phthiodiolone dimycocerosyl transferase family protein [Streptomyces sp. NPDC002537]